MAGYKPKTYSAHLLASLPIRRLLRIAERDQESYGLLFPQLLRLCLTQFPHLCLTEDWLTEEATAHDFSLMASRCATLDRKLSLAEASEAMTTMSESPSRTNWAIRTMLRLTPEQLWTNYADIIVGKLPCILDEGVTRQIQGKKTLPLTFFLIAP